MLILKDFKHNLEEEERVKLIITQEKDYVSKIKINTILLNTDWLQEQQTTESLHKSLTQHLKEIEYYVVPTQRNLNILD